MAQGIQDLQWQRSYNLTWFTQYSSYCLGGICVHRNDAKGMYNTAAHCELASEVEWQEHVNLS